VRVAPGNSGGPLLNARGAVVGITAMIFGGDLTVAIPSHVASAWVAGLPTRRVYLGVGVRPPQASWGNMLLDASGSAGTLWWLALFPGLAIIATVLAFTALGDALRDALDPRTSGTRD